MFKIGEFSRISQVPTKTLRYYDEIVLFKPARVDPFTGYRYYTLEQLNRLHTILALKDLDFSLEQIGRLLDDALTPEQIRGMLRLKQAEIEQRVEVEGARLARVEARLKQLEENRMPEYDVVLKKVEPVRALVVRDVLPDYQSMGRLYMELMEALQAHNLEPAGPMFGIYYDDGYKETDVDVEVGVPVASGDVPAGERVTIRTLPAVPTAAAIVRQGPYDDFNPAYTALVTWIKDSGFEITGHAREIFLRGPAEVEDQNDCVVEILYPVTKA
jgi:DNA-binding transcriptional MerR regulator